MAQSPGKSHDPSEVHAPELNPTQARGGERRGLYRVLTLSTLLALVVLALVWLAIGAGARHTSPHTGPDGLPDSAANQPAGR